MARRYKEPKKSKGCCGVIFVLCILLVAAIIVLLCFTDVLDSQKHHAMALLYPKRYNEYVERYCGEFHVEEPLVYSVIKNESGFDADAGSDAGAQGLMQIMPETFDWLQTKLDGDVTHSTDELKDPGTNIKYGTYLLSFLKDRYQSEDTAIAAYNAGFTIVDEWLEDSQYSDDGVHLKYIPYEETENYVKKVTDAKAKYQEIYYE